MADELSWTTLAAAAAIVVGNERLLLVRQRRPYGVHWELPGGYWEAGESLEQTAAREVLEETGIPVEVGDLVCTMVWKREHDMRRNMLAFFVAKPLDPAAEPRAQTEEDIEAAAWLDPAEVFAEIHPLEQTVLERWQGGRATGFHVHADVSVNADGTQSYAFR